MNYPWLEDYLIGKPHARKEYKPEYNADRYLVAGKLFAMVGQNSEAQPILTLKLAPPTGEFLRKQYADIVPGYYMNKVHWNSLNLLGKVPPDLLREMVDESYQIVFSSLPKKVQQELCSH